MNMKKKISKTLAFILVLAMISVSVTGCFPANDDADLQLQIEPREAPGPEENRDPLDVGEDNEPNPKEVNFTLALGRVDYGLDPGENNLDVLVDSYAKWLALDAVRALPELAEKYSEQFFMDYALAIFAFRTPTSGGQIEEIKLRKEGYGNELLMDVSVELGLMDAESFGIVVVEIKKADILGVTNLRTITNF